MISTHRSKGHHAAEQARRTGSSGPASPIRLIDPKSGKHIGTEELIPDAIGKLHRLRCYAPAVEILSLGTARKRRCRALDEAGGRVLDTPVQDRNGLVELLLDLDWLLPEDSEDWRKVGSASGMLLDDLVNWASAMRRKHGHAWTDYVRFQWSNRRHDTKSNSGPS